MSDQECDCGAGHPELFCGGCGEMWPGGHYRVFSLADVEKLRVDAVQGVLDLMNDAGRPREEWSSDTIVPYSNGYGCWFITAVQARGLTGTAPLAAEQILAILDGKEQR